MEKEVLFGKVHISEEGESLLEYYMITEEIAEEFSPLKSYGVRINKTTRFPGGRKTAEMKQINGIFYRYSDVEEFLMCLLRNSVTPISLLDVTEDYIIEASERVIAEKRRAV